MWTHSGVSYAPQPNENEKYYKKKKARLKMILWWGDNPGLWGEVLILFPQSYLTIPHTREKNLNTFKKFLKTQKRSKFLSTQSYLTIPHTREKNLNTFKKFF